MQSNSSHNTKEYQQKIQELKRKKDAVILAHYYQEPEIQEIADFVGDSLGLSQHAAKTQSDIIVFAGVHFMAETAKILNPTKKVLLPDLNAGCSLEESCPPDKFKEFIDANPNHTVISYINCSADVKAMSDIICTSSNALKIVESLPQDSPIIFAPDKNLGKFIQKKTNRDMKIWDGACVVHEAFSLEKINTLFEIYPDAILIAHPESKKQILKIATYIGSTSGMINYVKNHPDNTFIVATEAGILHQMKKEVPNTKLIPAPAYENNTCACSECSYMKMNTIEKLYACLLNESPEVLLEDSLRLKALKPIEKMLELSK
ncbi:MAG: quinolinate synthase NadA [Bacteroidetes bacterium]|nr:quinolinate synthase NadA [Bacteroidota bacterium]